MSLKRPAPGTRSQKLSTVRPGRLRAASPTNHLFFEWSDMFQPLIFRAVESVRFDSRVILQSSRKCFLLWFPDRLAAFQTLGFLGVTSSPQSPGMFS